MENPARGRAARQVRTAHFLWAVLIARIYEMFALLCPICGGQMCIIAIITHGADGVQIESDWNLAAQPAPNFDLDQRVDRRLSETASQIGFGAGAVCVRPNAWSVLVSFADAANDRTMA